LPGPWPRAVSRSAHQRRRHKPGLVEMIFCVDDETKAHAALHGTEGENVGVAD
jgi:hypothetical protein